jgi:hypothetical protein
MSRGYKLVLKQMASFADPKSKPFREFTGCALASSLVDAKSTI